MKSPDEIKKGLRCLSHDRTHTLPCSDCEYHGQGLPPCRTAVHEDAIALTEQLEADKQQLEGMLTHMNQLRDAAAERALKMEERVHQLEAERDAAVAELRCYGCDSCAYRDCDSWKEPCLYCIDNARWEWQGAQKEVPNEQA